MIIDILRGRRALRVVLAAVAAFAALLVAGPATASAATPAAAPATAPAATAPAAVSAQAAFRTVALSSLPAEATDTYDLIRSGGPFPYSQDGTTFGNREGILPAKSSGYYKEYTVTTPGSSDRGARRIIAGSGGEYYYTADHYESFVLVDVSR